VIIGLFSVLRQSNYDSHCSKHKNCGEAASFIMRWILRSKIHRATVTEANLDYIGSITIDQDLIDKTELMIGEKVLVVDNTNGARVETYVIPGRRDSGIICMNGAAAHLIKKGDQVIIMGFELTDTPIKPKSILVDNRNKFVRFL